MRFLLNKGIGRIPYLFKIWRYYFKFINPKYVNVRGFKLTTKVPIPYVVSTYYYGNYGGKTFKSYSNSIKKGDIVFDVGAHIGYFTLEASKKAKNVYSFEPNLTSFNILKENIEINELSNVTIMNKAISDKRDFVNLFKYIDIGWGEWEKIGTIDLDSYTKEKGIKKIDILKIDVDGFEWMVLKGGRKIIKASPNIKIFLEIVLKDHIIPKEIMNFINEENFTTEIFSYDVLPKNIQVMEVLLERK